MEHVQTGALDADVADDCVADFYVDRFPDLKLVGWPNDGGYYVALVALDQPRLQDALDAALKKIIVDGRLKQLYDRWDLDGRWQMLMLARCRRNGGRRNRFHLGKFFHEFASAAASGGYDSVSVGHLVSAGDRDWHCVAIGRLYGPWPIAKPLGLYVRGAARHAADVAVVRDFFLAAENRLAIHPLVAGIAGLAINYSAYEAEIYRAGLQAISRGQMEAALALGMSQSLAIRRILLPQAFRIVIPPVTNDFIALFKDTSVCSVITIVELTKRYSILALSTGAIVQLAAITAVLYMLMSVPLSLFARWSERQLGDGQSRS